MTKIILTGQQWHDLGKDALVYIYSQGIKAMMTPPENDDAPFTISLSFANAADALLFKLTYVGTM